MHALISIALWMGLSAAPEYRLTYARDEAAAACPDEASFRNLLAAQLGKEPFVAKAQASISIQVSATARQGFSATLKLTDAQRKTVGRREFSSAQPGCRELTEAMLLATSLAVDPLYLSRKTSPKPLVAQAPLVTVPAPVPQPVVEAPSQSPWQWQPYTWLGAGARPSPFVTATAHLALRARTEAISLGLEAFGQWPVRMAVGTGFVETSVAGAAAVPCFRQPYFSLCGVSEWGVSSTTASGFPLAQSSQTLWTTVGARVEGHVFIEKNEILLLGQVQRALVVTRVRVEPFEIWRTPDWIAQVGMGYAWSL